MDNGDETKISENQNNFGYETYMTTNYLSHALLILLLLKKLKTSAPSRIVVITSTWHRICREFDHKNFHLYQNWFGPDEIERYCKSKLALVMFISELHKRIFRK